LLIALGLLGVPALGIDISAEAVAQARRQGGNALLLDVFDPVPGEGNWETVVLADGNVGIGGDPVRLLQRATRLSTPDGRVVVELGSPGSGSWSRLVKLHHAGSHSPAFWWAALAADDVAAPAARARLTITRKWSEAGRWFALLRKEDR
jgi:SAM-dependent methyltransferase